MACVMINEDPHLAKGYNAIGFSQGGQFLFVKHTFRLLNLAIKLNRFKYNP